MELLNNVYAWFNQLHIRFLSKNIIFHWKILIQAKNLPGFYKIFKYVTKSFR